MSVDDRRVVSADEAREVLEYERKPDALGVIDGVRIWPDLAHTVVEQAEQIAAVRAVYEVWAKDTQAGWEARLFVSELRKALAAGESA